MMRFSISGAQVRISVANSLSACGEQPAPRYRHSSKERHGERQHERLGRIGAMRG